MTIRVWSEMPKDPELLQAGDVYYDPAIDPRTGPVRRWCSGLSAPATKFEEEIFYQMVSTGTVIVLDGDGNPE